MKTEPCAGVDAHDCTMETLELTPFTPAFPGVYELLGQRVFDKMSAFRRY